MIRQLEARDADAVFALRRAALADRPLAFGAAPKTDHFASREAVEAYLNDAPERVLFGAFLPGADGEGALVGMAGLGLTRHSKRRHRASVWGMFVDPAARGQGFGRALVEALADFARTQGVAHLDLSVTDAAPEAERLYRAAGFVEYGRLTDSLRVGPERADEVFLTRAL